MGCWGITAFESDDGLDTVGFIRKNLPADGKLYLGKIIEAMQEKDYRMPDAAEGYSHTGPMALAEILVKFLNRDMSELDYDEAWAKNDNKFSSITSFTASKESVQWLKDYISDTLKSAKENAELRAEHAISECDQWGGWFEKSDWIGWQDHMEVLISHMDGLLALPENQIELLLPLNQENDLMMGQSF